MNITEKITRQVLNQELKFQATKSSGPGGQNVNKVNSKILLSFDIPNSSLLDETEKVILLKKLDSKLDSEGILKITTQEKRSQLQNKVLGIEKFYDILRKAFHKRKRRIATRPGKAATEKRIKEKKALGQKKEGRRKIE